MFDFVDNSEQINLCIHYVFLFTLYLYYLFSTGYV